MFPDLSRIGTCFASRARAVRHDTARPMPRYGHPVGPAAAPSVTPQQVRIVFLVALSLCLPASGHCEWQRYTSVDGLVNDYVNSIVVDQQGNLWFGTNYGYGGGVSRFDGVT